MSALAREIAAPFEEVGDASDRAAWLERRRSGVGASEAAIMLGQHPRYGEGGPAILWTWKVGRADPESLDELENVQWGHVMEPVIVEQYSTKRYAARRVEKVATQLRSTLHPWALCTLDAWTWHPQHGRIPLEVKNVGAYQAERWVDSVPIEMWWQLQHQMLVTGAPVASIAACVGGNALWWEDVPRKPEAQMLLEIKGAEFWRCVTEDRVPLHVPTLASVKALYPGPESGSIQISGPEWSQADERLCEIKRAQKELEAERSKIEAFIREAIGDHESAQFDHGVTYTLRTQNRKETTIPATSFRVLRRKES